MKTNFKNSLDALPSVDATKQGWPWDKNYVPVRLEQTTSQVSVPKVSLVTPSFNQGKFLEETIRSVLLQGYPNLEYIIIDGGSTDGSVQIIQKYEQWLTYWVSEKDRGQSHAINKGWAIATGEIVAFINSDDFYLPDALWRAVDALENNPDAVMVYSDGLVVDVESRPLSIQKSGPLTIRGFLTGSGLTIPQPTAFFRRTAIEAVEGLDESLHMAMDLDLWIKLAFHGTIQYIAGEPLAALRLQPNQKTQNRILEDRLCSLSVFDRGLASPKCPSDITRRNNRAYALLYYGAAEGYWKEKRDLSLAVKYLCMALRCRPQSVFYASTRQIFHCLYRRLIPAEIKAFVRRLRGTDQNHQLKFKRY